MGTLAQRFETGEQTSQKGHFRNLVLLARMDGTVTETEKQLLNKISGQLSLTDEQVKEILENPENYPSIPPYGKEERHHRLIEFLQIALDDKILSPEEETTVKKLATALGFSSDTINDKISLIAGHIKNGKSTDEIMDAII